jgi:POLQ-like helicase
MLIESTSKYLLKKTRAKAKMYEYSIEEESHIKVEQNAPELLLIAIGAIGNAASRIIRTRDNKILDEEKVKYDLEFSAKFFDAFLNSMMDIESDYYYYLLVFLVK